MFLTKNIIRKLIYIVFTESLEVQAMRDVGFGDFSAAFAFWLRRFLTYYIHDKITAI